MRTPGSSSPFWMLFNGLTSAHVRAYRLLGGRGALGGIGNARFLLLHHTGARSGKERVAPLLYLDRSPQLVIVASKGGTDRHPAWFHNLKANPETLVEVGSAKRRVRARLAERSERAELWPQLDAIYPGYEGYRRQADEVGREIPLVVLDPA